jgi:hypothetical protein
MKKFIATLLIAVVATVTTATIVSAQAPVKKIKGNGVIVTKSMPSFNAYSTLDVSTCINLTVSDRRDGEIKISADENIMPYIEIITGNGLFRAKLMDGLTPKNVKGTNINIEIPFSEDIRQINATAASRIVIVPAIESSKVNVLLSNSAILEAKIRTQELGINMKGGCNAVLDIDAPKLVINVSGGSTISPMSALANDCTINAIEAGKVVGELTTTNLDCEVSGASNVNLSGVGRTVKFEVSGTSRLGASNFVTDHCTLEVNGASYAHVNCTNSLTADSSGSSQVYYAGECKTTVLSDRIIHKQ